MKTNALQQTFETSIVEIRAKFIGRVAVQIEELDIMMERLEANVSDREALGAAINLTHKIAGVAPTLGLAQIGQLARQAEGCLIALSRHADRTTLAAAVDAAERLSAELDDLDASTRGRA